MKFLPTKIHGILDYVVGIVLILLPNIFGFADLGGAASNIPRVLGVLLVIYSLFTNYEWGLVKVLPVPYHLVVDFLASLWLIASPFLFGFNSDKNTAWLPDVVIGIAVILVVLVSQTSVPAAASKKA